MSTTFGIPQRSVELYKLCDEEGELLDYIDTSFFEKVFYRGNGYGSAGSRWMNIIARLLPHDTPVYALDNTAQGIHTIGDILDFLQTQHEV
tara:strand:- start:29 stop:301 length:273 start_codon:yes stop_codon:yes gene_type:complete